MNIDGGRIKTTKMIVNQDVETIPQKVDQRGLGWRGIRWRPAGLGFQGLMRRYGKYGGLGVEVGVVGDSPNCVTIA